MRRYETILITHVDLSEDELAGLIARYGGIVTAQKGILVKIERWGKRKLAYIIKKQSRGFYIVVDFAGESDVVNELERNLKIDDKILKFMTILKADAVDAEALLKELAEAEAKDQQPPAAPQAAPVEVSEDKAAPESAPVEVPEDKAAPEAAQELPPVPEENSTEEKGGN